MQFKSGSAVVEWVWPTAKPKAFETARRRKSVGARCLTQPTKTENSPQDESLLPTIYLSFPTVDVGSRIHVDDDVNQLPLLR